MVMENDQPSEGDFNIKTLRKKSKLLKLFKKIAFVLASTIIILLT